MNYYLQVLSNYANFKGRASRREYWMYTLFNILVLTVCIILDNIFGITYGAILELTTGIPKSQFPYGSFYAVYTLLTFIPGLAVAVRRLHDIGKSGWMLLLSLIPLIGGILLIIWFCKEGQKETNKWGEITTNVTEEKQPNKKLLIILLSIFLGLSVLTGVGIYMVKKQYEAMLELQKMYEEDEEMMELEDSISTPYESDDTYYSPEQYEDNIDNSDSTLYYDYEE